jgi:hypothetical protein
MKYKIGDRVRIKNLDWYNQNKDEDGFVHCGDGIFDNYMSVFCGSVVTICGIYPYYGYDVREDMQCRTWTDDMFEGLVDAEPQEKMVSLDDVCKFLDEHLYTGTSTGDYDYGQEYIYSDFDNVSDLIFALRKAMEG